MASQEPFTVLVTGASGYVAAHVVALLQKEGHRVRGTVRSLQKEERVAPLRGLVPDAPHPLELYEAELGSDKGWAEAVQGCDYVMHTASPFPNYTVEQMTAANVVTPAVDGTVRVLTAAAQAGVRRVVLTSSVMAVQGNVAAEENKHYTEEDWTVLDHPTTDLYMKSKTLAEKAAWDLLAKLPDEKKFGLSVVNPSFVMGPPLLASHGTATSVAFLTDLLSHKEPALIKMHIPFCDVRDVAKAHLQALLRDNAQGHRHIVWTESAWYSEAANILAQEYKPKGYKIATAVAPNFAISFMSLFRPSLKPVVPTLGREKYFSNSRMVEELGITPTPLKTSLLDMAEAVIALGLVKPPRGQAAT